MFVTYRSNGEREYRKKVIGSLLIREVERTSNGGCVVRGTWEGSPPIVGDLLSCGVKSSHIRQVSRPDHQYFLFSSSVEYFEVGEVWNLRV